MAVSTSSGKAAQVAWLVSYILAISGTILVLCGIASLQNLCHTDGPIVTNSRKLLQIDPSTLLAACTKAYRFQWWGWALQTSFVTLVAIYWAAGIRHAGSMIVGGCSTVLAMIFCNEQLQASDDVGGKAFSRTILLFIGWLIVCCGNFLLIIFSSHLPDPKARAAGKKDGAATTNNVSADATSAATA